MKYEKLLEETISDIGGCGPHQWMNSFIIHGSKIVTVFSTLTMSFAGQSPGFKCRTMSVLPEKINQTDFTDVSVDGLCELDESTQCDSFRFHTSMRTVVSEWDLVCSRSWIEALITSLQMLGVVLGCLLSGYISDYLGPKSTFFIGLSITVVFNFIGIFSTYMEVYIVIRFIIGMGIGLSITVQFALTIEYAPVRCMPLITAVPSVPLAACLFAPVAMWLHDWKMIHLFIALAGFLFIFSYWLVPESFRWHIVKNETTRAKDTINMIAWVNRKKEPEIKRLISIAVSELQETRSRNRNVFADLFSKDILLTTAGLYLQWFTAGYTYFGLIFGVNILYGNLFLNMFLINVMDVPLMAFSGVLVDWFGRKKYGISSMIVSSLCGLLVGIFQNTHFQEDWLITVFALLCKMTGASAWVVLMIYTLEIYPNGVRTLAFGFHYTGALVGSVVAPQIKVLNEYFHGLLYLVSGILMCFSVVCFLFFRETRSQNFETLDGDMALSKDHRHSNSKLNSVSSMEIP